MKTIYKGQSKLRLIIDTGCDLRGMETAFLGYRKPDGTTGSVPCGIMSLDEGSLFCDAEDPSFLDVCGIWTVWPEVTFDDGRTAYGKPSRLYVGERGR